MREMGRRDFIRAAVVAALLPSFPCAAGMVEVKPEVLRPAVMRRFSFSWTQAASRMYGGVKFPTKVGDVYEDSHGVKWLCFRDVTAPWEDSRSFQAIRLEAV